MSLSPRTDFAANGKQVDPSAILAIRPGLALGKPKHKKELRFALGVQKNTDRLQNCYCSYKLDACEGVASLLLHSWQGRALHALHGCGSLRGAALTKMLGGNYDGAVARAGRLRVFVIGCS